MKHSFKQKFFVKAAYVIVDAFFIALAFYVASVMRDHTLDFEVTLQNLFFSDVNPYRFVLFFWGLMTLFVNNANKLYQTQRELYETLEIMRVALSVSISAVMTTVVIYILRVETFPRSIFLISSFFIFLYFSVWRIAKRLFVSHLVRQGYNNMNALIVGAGKVGVSLYDEIEKKTALGIKVVGFLDDFKAEVDGHGDRKILGKLSEFKRIAQEYFVDKLFITIHHDSCVFLKLIEEAKELGIAVRVVPQGFDLVTCEMSRYNIGFIPILEYSEKDNFKRQFGKRLFDFALGLAAFFVLVPTYVIIAVMIKLDSRGPVIYKSKRYGRNGKMFNMYKFRSMKYDADKELGTLSKQNEADGPIFKIKSDPRITRVGQVLRRFSFDELPQIVNVLKGDMSLVGPRPLPIAQIEKEDLRQLKRLKVRPGITGLWQVRGRSDISFFRLVKWDIWYINNWSLWLDVNILIQTVPVVFHGKGAY